MRIQISKVKLNRMQIFKSGVGNRYDCDCERAHSEEVKLHFGCFSSQGGFAGGYLSE